MNINELMRRIWKEQQKEIELSNSEWKLLLAEWPDLYGNVGNIRKPPEVVEKLREDWKSRECFYLYGREIKVTITV